MNKNDYKYVLEHMYLISSRSVFPELVKQSKVIIFKELDKRRLLPKK